MVVTNLRKMSRDVGKRWWPSKIFTISTNILANVQGKDTTHPTKESVGSVPDDSRLGARIDVGNTQLRQKFGIFLGDVTINGVKYTTLPDASAWRKGFWACLVMFGCAFAVYQLVERVQHYYSRPTKVREEMFYVPELRFPTVTICNENRVVRRKAMDVGGEDLVNLLMAMFPPVYTSSRPELNYTQYNFTGIDFGHVYDHVAQNATEAIVACHFDGRLCHQSEFIQVNTNVGYCFQFNPEAFNLTTTRPGAPYGLKLVLFVDQDQYTAPVWGSMAAGFRVSVHAPTDVPLMRELFFRVSPDQQACVPIQDIRTRSPGKPYTDCVNRENYSYTRCLAKCEARFVIERCGCKERYMEGDVPVCNPEQYFGCFSEAEHLFITGRHEYTNCDCPNQCNTQKYTHTTSSAAASQFFVDHMASKEYHPQNDTDETKLWLRKNYATIEIFYCDVAYEETATCASYDLMDLMCDVGGALGLILGSTVLTVFEVFDFVFVQLWDWYRRRVHQVEQQILPL